MKTTKTIIRNILAVLLASVLIAAACSSNGSKNTNNSETSATTSQAIPTSSASASTTTTAPETQEETSTIVPFTAENGSGSVVVSGDNSPVLVWFANQPGEMSLNLVDVDVTDIVSVAEELVSFWFFSDDDSGDVPPSIFESANGDITDSFGTRYVIEAQGLPPAPGTESTATTTTTTTSSTTSTTSSASETSETPNTTTTTSTTTVEPATTTTTVPVVEDLSPSELVVQVLNGSGIAGAAGRLSASLEEAGYAVLPAGNAPERFASSAVYYVAVAHKDEAEILAEVVSERVEEVDGGGVAVAGLPASGQIPAGSANVVVLIGADDLGGGLRTAERSSGLRRTPDFGTLLPLANNVPRDRFVTGLLDVQIFTAANDEGSDEMKGILNALSGWFNVAGRYMALAERRAGHLAPDLEEHMDYGYLQNEVWINIERSLEWLGFTAQNVCGAPAGYSFTDLIKPTREFDIETQNYNGDAIFTTDRLVELHGGERINPEANLDFYIREALQTAYDSLRLYELSDETESMQIILCRAWKMPEGKLPVGAHAMYKAQFIPGVQPRESLLSQGTYHFKEISKNGNFAYLIVCHPTIGERYVWLWWREAGYRAEITGSIQNNGCQATYEADTYLYEDTNGAEDTFRFAFGERVFSAGDLLGFPRG